MKIIDGKKIAGEIKGELKSEITKLKKQSIIPGLAVVLVGNNTASQVYVRHKEKACVEMGIFSVTHRLQESIKETDLLNLIHQLNEDESIHGILVQLPLPAHIKEEKIILAIDPKKDVDCFHPENVGRMFLGRPRFLPCTPAGVIEIIKRSGLEIVGKNVTIVGRSNIVGKPLAILMLQENATVTLAHSKTRDLPEITKQADILVAAVGKAGLIKKDMLKKGAVAIDVGINRGEDGKLKGDIAFEEVFEKVAAITPVPGGVGPMTIAMLMKNTVTAAKNFTRSR